MDVRVMRIEDYDAVRALWLGFAQRRDLVYRDRALSDLRRIDT